MWPPMWSESRTSIIARDGVEGVLGSARELEGGERRRLRRSEAEMRGTLAMVWDVMLGDCCDVWESWVKRRGLL